MSLVDLPDELLEKIVHEMDGDTLEQFCLVSKRFSTFLKISNIKKSVFFKTYESFRKFCRVNEDQKLDWELEYPIDEVQAFRLRLCKNSWEDSYRCYKMYMNELKEINSRKSLFKLLPNMLYSLVVKKLSHLVLFLVLFSSLVLFTSQMATHSSSFFSSTLLSVAFLSLIFFNLVFLDTPKKEFTQEWRSLLVPGFTLYFCGPLLFVEGTANWRLKLHLLLLFAGVTVFAIRCLFEFHPSLCRSHSCFTSRARARARIRAGAHYTLFHPSLRSRRHNYFRLFLDVMCVLTPFFWKQLSSYLVWVFVSDGINSSSSSNSNSHSLLSVEGVLALLARWLLQALYSFLLGLLICHTLTSDRDYYMGKGSGRFDVSLSSVLGVVLFAGCVIDRCFPGCGRFHLHLPAVVGIKVGLFCVLALASLCVVTRHTAFQQIRRSIVKRFRMTLIGDFSEPNKKKFSRVIADEFLFE